jgi:tetratricopeptide (TPR) repeat protein
MAEKKEMLSALREKRGVAGKPAPYLWLSFAALALAGLIYAAFNLFVISPPEYNREVRRAESYYVSMKFDKAAPIFEKLVRKQPHDPHTRMQLGVCYARLDEPEYAVNQLSAAIRLDPNYHESYANLSALYLDMAISGAKMKQPNEAETYLSLAKKNVKKALELDPGNTNYSQILKQIESEKKKTEK